MRKSDTPHMRPMVMDHPDCLTPPTLSTCVPRVVIPCCDRPWGRAICGSGWRGIDHADEGNGEVRGRAERGDGKGAERWRGEATSETPMRCWMGAPRVLPVVTSNSRTTVRPRGGGGEGGGVVRGRRESEAQTTSPCEGRCRLKCQSNKRNMLRVVSDSLARNFTGREGRDEPLPSARSTTARTEPLMATQFRPRTPPEPASALSGGCETTRPS